MSNKIREALVQSIVVLLAVPYVAWLSFKNGLWFFGRWGIAYFAAIATGCSFVGVADGHPEAGPLVALLMLIYATGIGFLTLGEREFEAERARKATEQRASEGEH